MRLLAYSTCIFFIIMVFGMCAYMCLMWLQVFRPSTWTQVVEEPKLEMSDFHRNEFIVDYQDDALLLPTVVTQNLHREKRTHNMHQERINDIRLKLLKTQTVARLRSALMAESNNMNFPMDNPYDVTPTQQNYSSSNVICNLHSKLNVVKTVLKADVEEEYLKNVLPSNSLFRNNVKFNTCAVISSAGSFLGSNMGNYIDSHDVVLRFNSAPVNNYEKDVGSKTTMRILNSQILAKTQFNFLNSSLYSNVDLLVWDPSKYTSTLQEWIEKPEHPFIESYINFRRRYPKNNFHILDPSVLWIIWDFIQGHTKIKIKPNPPSSAFIGIVLLLPHCSTVNVFEYVPTKRTTQRCHYYSKELDSLCTFGVWHPLAAEKLLALEMNVATDATVFYDGFVSIPGYDQISC